MTNEYSTQALGTILSAWLDDTTAVIVEPHLTSSGLSGALIWRVTHRDKPYCLRRWPREHPEPEVLTAIHSLLQHVSRQGIDFVPVPIGTVVADGHIWELSPWMPGAPYNREWPSRERLLDAMRCLARFHLAARSFPGATLGPAPGLLLRRQLLRELQVGGLSELRSAARNPGDWADILGDMLKQMDRSVRAVLTRIEAVAETPVPLQWCLRDVKCDHALFDGEQLVGLIDFGAAAIDSVAGDIARLVGSMVEDAHDGWLTAIDAYHAVRPLSFEERRAIELFDAGGTLVASSNWSRWLLLDGRQFGNFEAVRRQLEWLLCRLRALP